ncbi:Por secretion system C-terminal sorting domain-containing protein [Lutibacter oricola]|uniref:Por secretion system C-terminal sorting domain-containing protein n=1 Tax=Lutibacter oricola TaxID=762486 RepID=A0A1H2W7E1_9FLAO|nr:T9SS type A sorting domain-containing protein [Lutibacter oricola]SDW76174.1 Por secretion system C-terminal sorting domain-containing protein [Lutibacter oricola]
MKKGLFLAALLVTLTTFSQQAKVNRSYFKDSVVAIEKFTNKYYQTDSLKTYYKNGNINEVLHFNKGKLNGFSFKYNQIGEKLTSWKFNNGRLVQRLDFKIDYHKKNKESVLKRHNKLKFINNFLIKNKSGNVGYIIERAFLRYQIGNTMLALKDFEFINARLIKREPFGKSMTPKQKGSIYDVLARIHQSFEQENKAINYHLEALKVDPNSGRLYYNLGSYLVDIKEYDLAHQYLQKTLKFFPKHPFTFWSLSKIYLNEEKYEEALKYSTLALQREKHIIELSSGIASEELRYIKGFALHKLGKTKEGLELLKKALDLNPNNVYTLKYLGIVYYDLGKFTEACQFFTKSLDLGYVKIADDTDIISYKENCCNNKNVEITTIKEPYIYPNPAKTTFRINNYNKTNFEYELYNFNSKLIRKSISENEFINVSNLASGLYVLKIKVEEKTISLRLVKN